MKTKILAVIMAVSMIFAFTACGSSSEQDDDGTKEVALVISGEITGDGSFNEITWNSIEAFCSENDISCGYFTADETKEGDVEKTVAEIVTNGGELIIFAGSNFAANVYALQDEYKDTDFILLDGVPNNGDGEYSMAGNSYGVLFAEEQAGYMAGYAAVVEGYTALGFMGGKELPPVKRYGYGFIQGASAAAEDYSVDDITVNYKYENTFDASTAVKKDAAEWYNNGTEVIFACGGSMGKSVMKAAEGNEGKVIGVDSDQSAMSETVITSATKGINTAVEDMLKEYRRGNFIGNNVAMYSASNNGVGLEMDNAKFSRFSNEDYEKLINSIQSGSVEIKKDTGVKDLKDLENDRLKIKFEDK